MNKIKQLALIALVGLTAALSGCGGGDVTRSATEPIEVNGVKVDLPKLEESFATATEEQRAKLTDITSGIRYGQYTKAMMALEALSGDTTLNADQKQNVTTVFEQVKQLASKAPAPEQQ
jgi:hypothetical protein